MKNKMLSQFALLLVIVLLAGLFVTGTRGQASRTMQTWEYKSLILGVEGQRVTLREDGEFVGGSVTPVTRAPELGAQGWELVSVTAAAYESGPTYYVYWFKRPKK